MSTVSIIRCKHLIVTYGDFRAVDNLDLEVEAGECFGLLGPNGAGKTTTVEALEGLIKPTAGQVELFNTTWGTGKDRELRARFGVALQETRLTETLTVFETVRLFRSFYRTGREIDEVIHLLGLTEKSHTRVGKLSGGMRQRLSLACALVGSPELLFLDEPTTGLDPQARLRIWEVVESFTALGGTVLLTTHYMEEAQRLCKRVAIIDHGRRLALDSPENLIRMLGASQVIEVVGETSIEESFFTSIDDVSSVHRSGETVVCMVENINAALPRVLQKAAAQGITLRSVETHRATLEDVFLHLTGRDLRDE